MQPQLNVSREQWNDEFRTGRWDYLDSYLNERARHAIIGTYCNALAPSGAILDVGCGEGTLTDFLSANHKERYLGIDISDEAVKKAVQKRDWKFTVTPIETFEHNQPFDIIVCNEMLYYVDAKAVVEQLLTMLQPEGHLIFSLYHTEKVKLDEPILRFLDSTLVRKNTTKIIGDVDAEEVTWTVVAFTKR
ncbi:MAG: nodulation S family protein [Candidatus Uhrbacteria bacterium]|nr:nodulation S family protein [Candidatus Uhrbacteria bacterium]